VTIADIFKHPWVQHVRGQLHPASHEQHTDGLVKWLASAAAGGCYSIPPSVLRSRPLLASLTISRCLSLLAPFLTRAGPAPGLSGIQQLGPGPAGAACTER
jgi:hypothetical protein